MYSVKQIFQINFSIRRNINSEFILRSGILIPLWPCFLSSSAISWCPLPARDFICVPMQTGWVCFLKKIFLIEKRLIRNWTGLDVAPCELGSWCPRWSYLRLNNLDFKKRNWCSTSLGTGHYIIDATGPNWESYQKKMMMKIQLFSMRP